MALQSQTLFNYGTSISIYNQYIDFRIVALGTVLTATIQQGYYSLTSLGQAITNALSAADPTNTYTFSVDRSLLVGNRITISTSGSHLELLFSSGPSVAACVGPTLGYLSIDYTGSTTYTGANTCGTVLLTQFAGYNYISPDIFQEVQGAKSISASGIKESIVFNIQQFIDVEYKYETKANMANWLPFFQWAIQQREFEMTPEYTLYNAFYRVTLEKSSQNSNGLGIKWKEMLPNFPNLYQSGPLTFRVIPTTSTYIIGA